MTEAMNTPLPMQGIIIAREMVPRALTETHLFGRFFMGRDLIVSEEVCKNVILDAGAVEIVKWLVNTGSPKSAGAFKYMMIGYSDTAAAHDQTALQNEFTIGGDYARVEATLTAQAESTYGNKVFQAVATFSASEQTNRDTVNEMGMNDSTSSGITFNRVVFGASKDNQNNDLQLTYQCTVAPVT